MIQAMLRRETVEAVLRELEKVHMHQVIEEIRIKESNQANGMDKMLPKMTSPTVMQIAKMARWAETQVAENPVQYDATGRYAKEAVQNWVANSI